MSSEEEIEDKIEQLLKQRDKLEGKCDTLENCGEPHACEKCANYDKIQKLDEEVEALEAKLEGLTEPEDEGITVDEEEEVEEVKPAKKAPKADTPKATPKAAPKATPKKKK